MKKYNKDWYKCIIKASPIILIIGSIFTILLSLFLYKRAFPNEKYNNYFIIIYFCTSQFLGFGFLFSIFNEYLYQRHFEEDGINRQNFIKQNYKSVFKMYPLYLIGLILISYIPTILILVGIHIIGGIPFEEMSPKISNYVYELSYILIFILAINTRLYPPWKVSKSS